MLYPTINELLKNINNRYSLVLATAKRARQIAREIEKKEGHYPDKPVIMAIDEIHNGKVKIIKNTHGRHLASEETEY
jgi:DNA-directed RNA polymerase subunit omega